jgi:uncharacterized repeat protein (TIGR02543 family)
MKKGFFAILAVLMVLAMVTMGCDTGNSPSKNDVPSGKWRVTFDYDKGTGTPAHKDVDKGTAVGTLPTATKAGFSLEGWYEGTTKWDTSTIVTKNVTLKAKWTTVASDKWLVSFDYDGGTGTESSRQVTKGAEVGALPTATKDGFSLDGWYVGTTKWEATTTVAADVTLKAKWTALPSDKWLVTFNYDGGTGTESSRQVTKGAAVGALPAATKANNTLDGWYEGATKWESATLVTKDVTLTAKWTPEGGGNKFVGGTPVQTDAKTVTHENPRVELGSVDLYGEGATFDETNGSVTLEGGGALSYKFPEMAAGYTTVMITYTVERHNQGDASRITVKQYGTLTNYVGPQNDITPWLNAYPSQTYEIAGFGEAGGFSWFYDPSLTNNDESFTIKISSIVFKKIDPVPDFIVDLSTAAITSTGRRTANNTIINTAAFTGAYAAAYTVTMPDDLDITKYSKFTMYFKFYKADYTDLASTNGFGNITWYSGQNTGNITTIYNPDAGTVNANIPPAVLSSANGVKSIGFTCGAANTGLAYTELTMIAFHVGAAPARPVVGSAFPQHDVSFETNGGTPSTIASVKVTEGAAIGANFPSDPTRDGYKFLGWYVGGTAGTKYTATAPTISAPVTLTAEWEKLPDNAIIVTFDANGGLPLVNFTVEVEKDAAIGTKFPNDPIKADNGDNWYKFDGWYDSSNTKYDSTTTIAADITLTAKWTETVRTFKVKHGSPQMAADTVDPLWNDPTLESYPIAKVGDGDDRKAEYATNPNTWGTAKLLWDESKLYMYVKVTDPTIVTGTTNQHLYDSFEICLYEAMEGQTLNPVPSGNQYGNYGAQSRINAGGTTTSGDGNTTRVGRSWATADGYEAILSVTWRQTGTDFEKQDGRKIGIEFALNACVPPGGNATYRMGAMRWRQTDFGLYQDKRAAAANPMTLEKQP